MAQVLSVVAVIILCMPRIPTPTFLLFCCLLTILRFIVCWFSYHKHEALELLPSFVAAIFSFLLRFCCCSWNVITVGFMLL